MPVVSNTSPLLNLAIIHQLHLLRQQFAEVLIPTTVQAELKLDTDFPGAATIRQALVSNWLREVELSASPVAQTLALELDQGEAEAIALALELKIPQVLMDERDGRAKAKALGLQPVGVLGVLLRAKREGQITSLAAALTALRSEAGFFVADELEAEVLREAGEA